LKRCPLKAWVGLMIILDVIFVFVRWSQIEVWLVHEVKLLDRWLDSCCRTLSSQKHSSRDPLSLRSSKRCLFGCDLSLNQYCKWAIWEWSIWF
jgi:hypothetical protein